MFRMAGLKNFEDFSAALALICARNFTSESRPQSNQLI